ncbi:MAG: hypothetical protein IKN72_03840 [Clostridia bacterium]|nr:hypothetical protein [Clostridia bacterium]
MNLFDMTDPQKVAETKRLETVREITNDPERWPTCSVCKTKISPLAVGDEIADGPVCLTCYMKRRNQNASEKEIHQTS